MVSVLLSVVAHANGQYDIEYLTILYIYITPKSVNRNFGYECCKENIYSESYVFHILTFLI